jgi:hypothetical protein
MGKAAPRAGRAGWLLAAAVLAGAVASWAMVLSGPQRAQLLAPLAGGLLPHQLAIEAAADQIERLAPVPQVLVLSLDPEDAAFARYRLYPLRTTEGPVRPRERLDATLAAAPDGALVLVTDPATRFQLLHRAPSSGGPRLVPAAELDGDVALLRVER